MNDSPPTSGKANVNQQSSRTKTAVRPDLNAIPLPSHTDHEPTHNATQITPKDVYPQNIVQPSTIPNDVSLQDEQCNSIENSSLSKVQMLIKQKTEKLKISASNESSGLGKPKSAGFNFAIGKGKVKSTEKVKFSVTKLDRKAPLFDNDSDEEGSTPLSHVTLSPLKISPLKPHSSGSTNVSRLPAQTGSPKKNVAISFSPTKGPNKLLTLHKVTSASRRLSLSEERQATNSLKVKEVESEIKKALPSSSSPVKSSKSQDNQQLLSATKIFSSDPGKAIKRSGMRVHPVIKPSTYSYEADSTIPDEHTATKVTNLTLYSDNECSADEESSALKPPSVSQKDISVNNHSRSIKLVEESESKDDKNISQVVSSTAHASTTPTSTATISTDLNKEKSVDKG